MKKFIIVLASIVTLLLIAAILIPIIFKDDIQKQVRIALEENIDAQIYFEPSKFGMTLFKEFPNPTAYIEDFGVVGTNVFEGDTLMSVGSFNITIDFFSLFGDQYNIKSVNLVKPRINIQVLKDGNANYDIVAEAEATEESEDEATSNFNLNIESWNISNGSIRYLDETSDMILVFEGLNHNGSGEISLDIYDLKTFTTIEEAIVVFEGTKYLSGQKLYADLTLNINMPESKFTFKENEVRVNDFPLSFDGFLAMPSEDISMDISFASSNSSILSLYSLIPGVYTAGYDGIKAEGDMSFSGLVKGNYNEKTMPAFNINLNVSDGMIAYPDLPTPIKNINIEMLVDCKDGVIDHTLVNIKKMHMDLGSNPFDGSLIVRNLNDYSMKAELNTSLNLEELSSMVPIEGLDMKGIFKMNLKAEGVYDSIQQVIPAIDAGMSLQNGYIKSAEFPKALENMSFVSTVSCTSGKLEDMLVMVKDFKLAMEGDELSANLLLKNMLDYEWDLELKGSLDLEVISEVYPIAGMKYRGHLAANVETLGKYSDVEAEKYDRFPTSGIVELSNFNFVSEDLPQGMQISSTTISMDPKQIKVDAFDGKIGRSDMKLNGFVTNYIDYIFKEEALLKGKMNLNSNVLDVNEWMSDETVAEETQPEDTAAMEVIVIPENIDFEFNSSIKTIIYDNLNLQNAKGLLTIRDGILDMSDLSFDMLGGSIVMNGTYDTRQPDKPAFDYNLSVQSLSIPETFNSFTTVQTFAPMAKFMNGDFSTDFNVSGLLKNDLSPVYESLNGKGLIKIAEAFVEDSKLVSGIAGFMKSDAKSSQMKLKDVIMKTSIENGRVHVAPFDVQMAGQTANLSGSIGPDGSIDYNVNTEVDAGVVGQQVNQLLAGLQGQGASTTDSKIKLNFKIGGTYDDMKIRLAGTTNADGTTSTVKDQVKQEVKQEVNQQVEVVKKEAEEKIKSETQELVEKAEEQLQEHLDTLKNKITENMKEGAGELISEELDSTANQLKNSVKKLFKRKKKN
jgi:uncharacterized protein involved in outer membrane biogenesis